MTYKPPSSAEWRAIKTSPGVASAVESIADDGLEYARSIAPVDSGLYRDSFAVETSVEKGRAVAHIVNTAAHAAEVEWGQQRHILSQTADFIEGGA